MNWLNGNQIAVIFSGRKKIKPLSRLISFDALKFDMRINQSAAFTTDNQSKNEVIRWPHCQYRWMFQKN